MNSKSTKKITKFHQTDKKRSSLILGGLISIVLMATPFLFYLYKFAPSNSNSWDTLFGTISSGSFKSVQIFMHAFVTKLTFVTLTATWFLTSRNWWKYAILVPLTMFLFQLSGVINHKISYIDEYDFWYSLPVILPILFFLIYISHRLSNRDREEDQLKEEVDDEISKIFSDKL